MVINKKFGKFGGLTGLTNLVKDPHKICFAILFALNNTYLAPETYAATGKESTPNGQYSPNKQTKKESKPKWVTLKNCQLVEHIGNDGDSFHIKHKNKEYVFRLYMVDCPETRYEYTERILKQMEYFEKSHGEIIQAGELAKILTKSLLNKPFTVYTSGENALGSKGSPRTYGFVVTSNGKDLGEILLKEGLARSYGKEPWGDKINPKIKTNYDNIQTLTKNRGIGIWTPKNRIRKGKNYSTPFKEGPNTSKVLKYSETKQAIVNATKTTKTQGSTTQELIETIKNRRPKNNKENPSIFKDANFGNNQKKEGGADYTISKEELEILLPKAKEIDYQSHTSHESSKNQGIENKKEGQRRNSQ